MRNSTPLQEIASRMKESIGDADNISAKSIYIQTCNLASRTKATENLALSRSPQETRETHIIRIAKEAEQSHLVLMGVITSFALV